MKKTVMLKLYSAPRTRGIRVAWLLEELGLPYELENAEFVQTKSTFFIQKTPTGKFPTIDDDGFVMCESGAILEYIIGKYGAGRLIPEAGTRAHGRCLQWMYFADATAFSPLGIVIWLAVYRDDAAEHPALIEDARARAATGFDWLAQELGDAEYLVDNTFSAADIMMGFTLLAARLLGIVAADTRLDRYLTRLEARPAYQRALEKTGGFTA